MNENLIVSLKDIVVEFDGQKVLDGLSLDIHDKEFVTFLGPSGCGKTTTLRVIAGFVTPKSGNVFFDGKDIANMPPYKRPVNTVFQKYALFPHLNVFENVAFGLRLKKMTEDEIRPKVFEMLEIVGLKGFERRSIHQLSGGQQQRVAIARSLVNQPRVLLLDEPLGALDLKLRKEMQLELKRLQREMNITFVYVTHDQEEALTMSDTVVVMSGGTTNPRTLLLPALSVTPTLSTASCCATSTSTSAGTTSPALTAASSRTSLCRSSSARRTCRSCRPLSVC